MTDRISSYQTGPATTFYVEGDLLSQSISGNYSVIRCYLRAKNGPGGSTGSYMGAFGYQAGTIAGVKEFARRSSTPFLPSGYADNQQRWRVGPYDVQVPHNSDGTRAPIRFGMVLSYPDVNVTVFSADMALPTIPRATKAQIRIGSTTVTSLDLGTAATVYLPRASSSFTHTLELWEYGGTTGAPIETLATGVGVSYAWTPPLSLATMFPDATSKQYFVRARTYNGSSQIGIADTVFTLKAPASLTPTISAINVADDNPTVASAIGGFVQGQSLLKAIVVAAGVQGSSITSSAIAVDGQSAASGTPVPLPLSGSRTVAASVTDSRGRVSTSSGTVEVLPYDLPTINSYMVERATSAGVPSPNGTYLQMTLSAAIASLIVGTQKNAMTIRVFTRPRGTSSWTARNVISTALAYDSSVLITGGGIYAANTAYDVRVEVSDKLQKSEDFWSVSTAGAIVDATATKQAFGKMVEASGPDTQIAGPARVYGSLDADEDIRHRGGYAVEPVGIITAFAGATAPDGWLLCDGGAVSRTTYSALFAVIGTTYGAGNGSSTFNVPDARGRTFMGRDAAQTEFDALGEGGGEKTVTLTAVNLPSTARNRLVDDGVFETAGGNAPLVSTSGSRHRYQDRSAPTPVNNLPPYLTVNHIIKSF